MNGPVKEMRSLLRFAFAGLLLCAVASSPSLSSPQSAGNVTQAVQASAPFGRIAYSLSMSHPATHLFEVSMDIVTPAGNVPASVDLQMPLWQPGRYSVADFAENVQEFSAKASGQNLTFRKTDNQTWQVQTRGNRTFSVSYKVYGNDLSGTFSQLDLTHGNFTGGEIFMYLVGHKQDAVELQINPPPGWRVINGRTEVPDQTSWRYPNYEMLIDNPTEVGADWTLDTFNVGGKTYRVVIHSRADVTASKANLIRDIQKIVTAEVAMWGAPEFDRYTFMIHFAVDDHSYDGMEHLVSTQIIRGGALSDQNTYETTLETVAHEFFHSWNVKRLRPVELGPWDWTRPANTGSLWIAEGLTQYYGTMMMRRSGLWDDSRTLRDIERTIGDVENAPGVRLMSAEDASLFAPFMDAEVYNQQNNFSNTTVSYYTKGELIGLILDLTIRERSGGRRSLDDVFKQMYDEFYVKAPNASYYLKGRGYTQEDFVRVLSIVAGTDMSGFYDRFIRGVETLPYDDAFAAAGLRLIRTPRGNSSSGITIDGNDRQSPRVGALRAGSAAQEAGLQEGDLLVSIGGARVSRDNWNSLLARYRPGERITIQVQRFRKTVELVLELREPELLNYRLEEIPAVSDSVKKLRNSWLTGQ
jgi:predicted metalloprotease with PDZ domain